MSLSTTSRVDFIFHHNKTLTFWIISISFHSSFSWSFLPVSLPLLLLFSASHPLTLPQKCFILSDPLFLLLPLFSTGLGPTPRGSLAVLSCGCWTKFDNTNNHVLLSFFFSFCFETSPTDGVQASLKAGEGKAVQFLLWHSEDQGDRKIARLWISGRRMYACAVSQIYKYLSSLIVFFHPFILESTLVFTTPVYCSIKIHVLN